ncbi:tryptophan 2,3-dioxygenase family protein [Streptomyces sp. NPDC006372]|uniref:tryptophan 2,3-dioxygenase n=1 Tax=Streptomyces sp. NPDC006372 TaxID=3155599 RepID=UPI0033B95B0E
MTELPGGASTRHGAAESSRSQPRAYRPLTEEERRAQAEQTGGEPVLDFSYGRVDANSTPYIDYHSVDTLLSLQHPRSDEPAELCFYITGQVQELLFKLMFTEVNRVRDLLFEDKLDDALWGLRRIERIQRALTASWEPVSTITPTEFAGFRDQLGSASGFQSYMYRQLEFSLGNKEPRMAEAYRAVPWLHKQMLEVLRAPSLYDAVLALLHKRGLPIPEAWVRRDFTRPYEPSSEVENAWAVVYRERREFRDLHMLAEALAELNYQYSRWRTTHLLTVERILGNKPGTGGTLGVAWLRKVAEHRFFPELWSVRSEL